MLAARLDERREGHRDKEHTMGPAIIRMLSVFSIAIALFGASALSGAARDQRCSATSVTYKLQLGPGGDFAGATVIHVDIPAASDDLAVDGESGTCS